jgi:hypothetical protein
MGVPILEVGYTSATTGRGDHEVHKGHVVALGVGGLCEISIHKLNVLRTVHRNISVYAPTGCTIYVQFISIIDLYMFRAGLLLIVRKCCMYSNWYVSCVYVGWLLAGSGWNLLMMCSKPARNMYVIYRNKLKTNSACCWFLLHRRFYTQFIFSTYFYT